MSHFDDIRNVLAVIGAITIFASFGAGLVKLQHHLIKRYDEATERREHADREAVARLRMKEWMKTNG